MVRLSNSELLELIKKRDSRLDSYFYGLLKSVSSDEILKVRKMLKRSKLVIESSKHEKLTELREKLKSESYLLTDKDVSLLRNYYIYVGGLKHEERDDCLDDTFVIISDLLGCFPSVESVVNFYSSKADVIYIMGNATERGRIKPTGSDYFTNLRNIKELSFKYPNDESVSYVCYVVGAKDYLLYGCYLGDEACLKEQRCTDYELQLIKENADVMEWLGEQYIQDEHCRDEVTYAMGYGFYNQELYDLEYEYGKDIVRLKDIFKCSDKELRKKYEEVIFLKKDAAYYHTESLPKPKDGKIIIVNGNASYKDSFPTTSFYNGFSNIPVVRIDGDMVFNDKAFTDFYSANYHDDRESILKNSIISLVYEAGSSAFDIGCAYIPGVELGEALDIINSIDGEFGFSYGDMSYEEKVSMYKKIFVFDTILGNLSTYCYSSSKAARALDKYISEGDNSPLTDDLDISYLGGCLGLNNMKEVLCAYNCSSVSDYVGLKFRVDNKKGVKVYEKIKPTE